MIMTKNKYRIHRFEVKDETISKKLGQFFNTVDREAISIIPPMKKG